MIYGYALVSTDAQDLSAQLREAGCDKIFRDKQSGTTSDRTQLKLMLRSLAAEDLVITPAVDWLSRDATDLLLQVWEIEQAGAGLKFIAEPFVDTTADFREVVHAMLGVSAKLERNRIRECTAVGRAHAKARGVKFGRKPKRTLHQRREALARSQMGEETLREIARSYNVSHQTISRLQAGVVEPGIRS